MRDLGALTSAGDVAIVALHGSWNRRSKDGYKVVSLHFGPGDQIFERDFLTGFLEDEDVIGRPVDVVQGPDGAVYEGEYYEGKKNGRGKLTFADGSVYQGEIQLNEIQGEGVYIWSD